MIEQIAQAIIDLNNSQPRLPTKEELVEVLAAHLGAAISPPATPLNAARDNYLASDWNRIVAAHLHHMDRRGKTDAEVEQLEGRLHAEIEAIWAKPCETWDDLVVRAAIACHWSAPLDADPALAQVVRGVLDLSGLSFDTDGRCITPEAAPSTIPVSIHQQQVPVRSVTEHPIVQEALAAVEDFEAVDLPYGEFDARADDEHDARLDAAAKRRDSVVRRIWSQAPTSVADIVARAVILESIMGGAGEVPGLDPTTVCDATAQVHLLDAIRKVLGGRKYPREGSPRRCLA